MTEKTNPGCIHFNVSVRWYAWKIKNIEWTVAFADTNGL